MRYKYIILKFGTDKYLLFDKCDIAWIIFSLSTSVL